MHAPHLTPARRWFMIVLAVVLLVAIAVIVVQRNASDRGASSDRGNQTNTPGGNDTPTLRTEVLASGRANIWDIAFLPTSELLFTERAGAVSVIKDGRVSRVAAIDGVRARGEGGLMGLAVDPQFADNRFIYACFNSTSGDIRVARWKLASSLNGLQDRRDIITGITANPSGRHSGCRIGFGPDKFLWVGTGDSATGTQPQDPQSLNGKILRVDRDGKAATGNIGQGFDGRVYSYGHRNTQGIAFFPADETVNDQAVVGLSAEHGSNVDDEVNELRPGNFGWAPPAGYNESRVPMTDKQRFPSAIEAVWSSGEPTQAPSGLAILDSAKWRGWNGAAVLAVLKDEHLKILRLDSQNKVTKEERALEGDFGRLRTVVQGRDGSLYVSTDNSEDDKIIRVTPNLSN